MLIMFLAMRRTAFRESASLSANAMSVRPFPAFLLRCGSSLDRRSKGLNPTARTLGRWKPTALTASRSARAVQSVRCSGGLTTLHLRPSSRQFRLLALGVVRWRIPPGLSRHAALRKTRRGSTTCSIHSIIVTTSNPARGNRASSVTPGETTQPRRSPVCCKAAGETSRPWHAQPCCPAISSRPPSP